VFLLKIPPNSFKHFRTHSQWFEKNQTPMETVITRIYFEQGITGTLLFRSVSYIQDEALFRNIRAMLDGKTTDALVGRTDVPRQAALPAPQTPALAAPALQPPPNLQQATPQQPAPFASGLAAPQPTQMAPAPQQPVAPPEPPDRRRRRAAAAEPAQAQVQPPVAQPAMQAPFQPVAAPGGSGAAFGMQAAPAPNADLTATLDTLFPKQ
jgi:hypothetical protein